MQQFIYEITVTLPGSEEPALVDYMRKKHVQDVIEHSAFSHAEVYRVSNPPAGKCVLTVHYHVKNGERFDEYKKSRRADMIADFMKHFGRCDPQVTRRILLLPEMIHRR